ncbi:hypothetical protein ACEWY4_006004 [Coilia grayii]|uniref:C-type lectin domain-containing protein n=1 Tax=Coilia grayii TaxID=363190 RepID=A0ABD1KCF5_9TELE
MWLCCLLSSDKAAVGVQARSTCDSGWTLHENRCFRFFNLTRTWTLAEAYCVTQQGHLASAHSIAEARFVGTLSGNRRRTWIGGVQTLANTWYWTDGTPFDYTNWQAWQPDNHGGNEHCIHTNFVAGGVWNNFPCNQELPFVCVK